MAEAVALPVEERARVVENLLSSLNPPDQAVDAAWASVARRRLDDLRSGRVEAIPGEVVFERIRQRYSK
ncbi:MAG: addiction module protein [Hydrogenophilales bacterium CG_4_9_14_3_um_filter_63_34]|nr:MAG: addiction module protein [Hydrogenophilales bacterium CG_4_9_14_3_um_filter_63_34]